MPGGVPELVSQPADTSARGDHRANVPMTTVLTSQPLPQMVSNTLSHLRDGYDILGGELDHVFP
jgi:hypothetical protein